MSEPKIHRLRRLKVTRIDLVDNGAALDEETGEGAHVLFWKRADPVVCINCEASVNGAEESCRGCGARSFEGSMLNKTIGKTVEDGESATDTFLALAANMVSKGAAKDIGEALSKAAKERPDLCQQYFEEERAPRPPRPARAQGEVIDWSAYAPEKTAKAFKRPAEYDRYRAAPSAYRPPDGDAA